MIHLPFNCFCYRPYKCKTTPIIYSNLLAQLTPGLGALSCANRGRGYTYIRAPPSMGACLTNNLTTSKLHYPAASGHWNEHEICNRTQDPLLQPMHRLMQNCSSVLQPWAERLLFPSFLLFCRLRLPLLRRGFRFFFRFLLSRLKTSVENTIYQKVATKTNMKMVKKNGLWYVKYSW